MFHITLQLQPLCLEVVAIFILIATAAGSIFESINTIDLWTGEHF